MLVRWNTPGHGGRLQHSTQNQCLIKQIPSTTVGQHGESISANAEVRLFLTSRYIDEHCTMDGKMNSSRYKYSTTGWYKVMVHTLPIQWAFNPGFEFVLLIYFTAHPRQ